MANELEVTQTKLNNELNRSLTVSYTHLEETVEAALKQIDEKNYDAELIKRGVKEENIQHYGFAFRGKEVLIDGR